MFGCSKCVSLFLADIVILEIEQHQRILFLHI
jgi:hypothetical protein